jgi:D-alanyl-D-alanine carboxypeptidase
MRSAVPRTARRSTRSRLAAAAAGCALLGAGALLSAGPASASAAQPRQAGTTLPTALRRDLSDYLTTRRTAEHISAVSLRITFRGSRPAISLADGTTRYHGGPPVSASDLWQIGSNTKAFTTVILLQLEAEGRLSINDPIGTWLPQYPAWRHITIRQLLDMTSRIPDYTSQPAFAAALEAHPSGSFTTAKLISYVTGLRLGPAGYHYTNTDYLLAQLIIEKVTGDSYASQLTRRIIDPLRLHTTCLAPYTCPPSDAARMPAGYIYDAGVPRSLLGKAAPPLALTWAQGAGGVVGSLADMTTWDRALYSGRLLPSRQLHELESLVSEATGKPIARTTPANPSGYGLGVQQQSDGPAGIIWDYEGETYGYRVLHLYFPGSGLIIALAANSATENDDLADLAGSVYQTLQKAGAVPALASIHRSNTSETYRLPLAGDRQPPVLGHHVPGFRQHLLHASGPAGAQVPDGAVLEPHPGQRRAFLVGCAGRHQPAQQPAGRDHPPKQRRAVRPRQCRYLPHRM